MELSRERAVQPKKAKTSASSASAIVAPMSAGVSLLMLIVKTIIVPRDIEHVLACVCKSACEYLRGVRKARGESCWKTPYSNYFSSFNTLKWAYETMPDFAEQHIDSTMDVFDALSFCGKLPLLKKLMMMVDGMELSYPRAQYLFQAAAAGGQQAVLQWLVEGWNSFSDYVESALVKAIGGSHTDVARWLLDLLGRCPTNHKVLCAAASKGFGTHRTVFAHTPFHLQAEMCALAAGGGHLDLLKELTTHGFRMETSTIRKAIANNQLGVYDWAMANGCPRLLDLHTKSCMLEGIIANNNRDMASRVISDFAITPSISDMIAATEHGLCFVQQLHHAGGRLTASLFEKAVGKQNLELMGWLWEQKCPMDEGTVRAAVKGRSLLVLEWMLAHSLFADVTACRVSAELDDVQTLQWLAERGVPWDATVGAAVVASGSKALIEWATLNHCPFGNGLYQAPLAKARVHILDQLKSMNVPFTTEDISFKTLKTAWASLLWLFDNNAFVQQHIVVQPTSFLITGRALWLAATVGATDTVVIERYEQLRQRQVSMTVEGCAAAATRSTRTALDWLLRHKCPLHVAVFNAAVGDLTRLRYLRTKGCPFDETTMRAAVKQNSIPAVSFLLENGCPRDAAACVHAAKFGGAGLKMMELLLNVGFELTAEAYTAAILSKNQHMMKAVHNKGCPSDEATFAAAEATDSCLKYIVNDLKKKHGTRSGAGTGGGGGKKKAKDGVKGNQASGGYGSGGAGASGDFMEVVVKAEPVDEAADADYFAELDRAFASVAAGFDAGGAGQS
jgi:hypothetical protein